MIAARPSLCRALAVLSLSALALPLLSGCKTGELAESTPIDEKFWERSEARRQAVADRESQGAAESNRALAGLLDDEGAEPGSKETAKPKSDRASVAIAQLGDPAEGFGEDDPFLADGGVKQVAAEAPRREGLLDDGGALEQELAAIRRDALARQPAATEPSLEWANEPVDEPTPAVDPLAEFDASEFMPEAETTPEVASEPVAPGTEQRSTEIPWDELPAGQPEANWEPAESRATTTTEPAVSNDMILDTLQIQPRGVSRNENLTRRIEANDPTAYIAPNLSKPEAATTPRPATATVEEVSSGLGTSPFEVPAPKPEPVEVAVVEQPTLTGPDLSPSPVLFAPANSADEPSDDEPESASLPVLVAPTTDSEPVTTTDAGSVDAPVSDPFLSEFPESVTVLETMDFDEETALPTEKASGSTTIWWFAAIGIVGALLLLRTRRRQIA